MGWGSATHIGNGLYITASHVAANPNTKLTIETEGGVILDATLVSDNHTFDFSIIKTSDASLPAVPMACNDPLTTGEHLTMHGSIELGLDFIETQGFIMGKAQPSAGWPQVVPIDGHMSWGQSGGGAINDYGELVGVNIGVFFGHDGMFPMGISYIVPLNVVCSQMDYEHLR